MGGKVREQKRARRLRAQGKSLNEIVAKLGVAKSSVSLWVRDVRLNKKLQQRLRERELTGAARGRKKLVAKWQAYRKLHPKPIGPRWPKRPVEQFFGTWSPDMAYVLGYFAADGTMYKNKRGSCYIGFCSTEKELIETTKAVMRVSNRIEEYQPDKPNHQKRYTLQIGSKRIYGRLLQLGFTANKSLTLRFPEAPNEFLADFLRGFMDGDGNVMADLVKRRDRAKPTGVLCLRLTSGSEVFLEQLRQQLNKVFGVGIGSLMKRRENHYLLQYSTRATRHLYQLMYPSSTVPHLKRKREKIEFGIKLTNQRSRGVMVT